jgi:hypothetical protein
MLAEGCNLVILLRDLRYEAAARRYWEPRRGEVVLGADPAGCARPKVVVRQVRYDFAQLYDWYQRIGPVTAVPGVVSTDIDERRNRIVIGMSGAPSRWLARRLAAGTPIPHGVVQIEAEEFGCSGGALSAVNVTVEDATSRRRLVDVPVTLVVREGAYADTMRHGECPRIPNLDDARRESNPGPVWAGTSPPARTAEARAVGFIQSARRAIERVG